MKHSMQLVCACLLSMLLLCTTTFAAEHGMNKEKGDTAIVLATFGTTVPSALPGIFNIRDQIQKKYPHTEVRVAFTSNMIRKIWHKRQTDSEFKKANAALPKDVYFVKGPLATIADLQDDGYSTILVQPGHITLGEEFLDLSAYVTGLNSIHTIKAKNQPFLRLAISRPALGTMGPKHPYEEDINEVAKALAGDVEKAHKAGCALVYMGHGNDYFPSSGSYLQLMNVMHHMYPDTKIYLATVEGFPNLEVLLPQLKKDQVKKIMIKPFMDVAGDHAHNDMAGTEPTSMKSILEKNGFQVTPVIQGMGEENAFADVFVHHLEQTAVDYGITLK